MSFHGSVFIFLLFLKNMCLVWKSGKAIWCYHLNSIFQVVLDHIWKLSDQLVPVKKPGDYNQAMMDLGATICTPKKPACKTCPVAHVCLANQRVQRANPLRELQSGSAKPNVEDIEDGNNIEETFAPWLAISSFASQVSSPKVLIL